MMDMPKFLTLADIKVGGKYIVLRVDLKGEIHSDDIQVISEPQLSIWNSLFLGVLRNGNTDEKKISARDCGLVLDGSHDNGHRTFTATPETLALIAGIVAVQDRSAYKRLTAHTVTILHSQLPRESLGKSPRYY